MRPSFEQGLELQRTQVLQDLHLLTERGFPVLTHLCERAEERFGVATALVTLIDTDRQIIKAGVGTDIKETRRSSAFCNHVLWSDRVLVVSDAREDDRFFSNPLVTGEPHVRFYAGAPLIFVSDVRLGGFCLLDPEPREFLDESGPSWSTSPRKR